MHRRSAIQQPHQFDALRLATGTWLASGLVLLGLTPLPLHDPIWGWSPAFWLLVAPCVLLLAKSMCARWVARTPSSHDATPHHRRARGVSSMAKRRMIAGPTNRSGLPAERRVRAKGLRRIAQQIR
ncbi:MAG: hypothetical protein ACREPY_03545 [Rhodanobacteraceae bacterium]